MAKIFTGADVILGSTTVKNVTQASYKSGQKHRKAMTSGGAVVSQISGQEMVQVSSITSADLATLVAIGTSTFCSVGLYLSATTITVPKKLRSIGGIFASGTVHPNLTGAAAFVVPTSFEVTQTSDYATGAFDVHWLSSDGQTAGCLDTASNALASQTFGSEFALGPCYINATLIPGVQGFQVDPGIEIVTSPLGSGSICPTWIGIKQVQPTIKITVNDFDAVAATIGLWTAMTSANCYMRKRVDSGVYSATTDNIRFTFAAGLTDTDSIDVSNNDDGSATITLHGKTLTASAAVAIP